jgi:hypothetical protein
MRTKAGAALKPLPIAIISGLLAACGQQPVRAPAPVQPTATTAQSDLSEMNQLIAATKQHPSVINAKEAGRPIHVNLPKPQAPAK